MVSKNRLHELIDGLPEAVLAEVEQYLETLGRAGDEGVHAALRDAPWDDEPETEEERRAVQEVYEAIARGEVLTDEELSRELGW